MILCVCVEKSHVKASSGRTYRIDRCMNGAQNTNENQLSHSVCVCIYVNPTKLNDIGNSHAKCELFLCVCIFVYMFHAIPLHPLS